MSRCLQWRAETVGPRRWIRSRAGDLIPRRGLYSRVGFAVGGGDEALRYQEDERKDQGVNGGGCQDAVEESMGGLLKWILEPRTSAPRAERV